MRLYVAVDGGFRLALDGPCAVALDAGDAVLLPVAVAHRVTAQHHPSEASLIVVSARFGTSFEPDEAGLARWPLIARGAMSHGVLSFALAAMELEAKEGHAGEAPALTRLADAVVSVFLRLSGPPPARTPARPDRRIAQALRAMHAAPERRWSVADLAEVAHMSRSGFCERFARVVGEAPVAHLASLRMQLAAQWVSATDMTLAEAANRLGYESAASFSRAFKRSHGVSPRDFRDRMRQARRAAG